jgi:hypothetical protein
MYAVVCIDCLIKLSDIFVFQGSVVHNASGDPPCLKDEITDALSFASFSSSLGRPLHYAFYIRGRTTATYN